MMALGDKIGAYVNAQADYSALVAVIIERGDYLTENTHVAVRGAVSALTEQADRGDSEVRNRIDALSAELKTGFTESISSNSTSIISAINSASSSIGSSVSSAISSLQSSISGMRSSMGSLGSSSLSGMASSGSSAGGGGGGGGSDSSSTGKSVADIVAEAKNEWNNAKTDAERYAAHQKAENARTLS